MTASGIKFSPSELAIMREVRRAARPKKIELFLVGGILRDLLLGRRKDTLDIDFCLKKGSIVFARSLARSMKAGFVVLDAERGASRVVKKTKHGPVTLDFTDFRGRTLKDDLLHRDFSINSMALGLEDAVVSGAVQDHLIDPFGGKRDIDAALIRAVNKSAFKEDPIRVLRLYSFSAGLDFDIDKITLSLARKEKERLSDCSGERVRDELFKVLDNREAAVHLSRMYKAGILQVLFPEIKPMRGIGRGGYHHLDVMDHTLETISQLDALIGVMQADARIKRYLDEEISAGRRRRALLKFGAFLHDIGKPQTMRRIKGQLKFYGHERIGRDTSEEIGRRIKLSNEEIGALRKMVLWHLRPGYLAGVTEVTARARFRFFRDTAKEALSVLILSLADQQATCGPKVTAAFKQKYKKTVLALIDEYFRKQETKLMPRLINGNELMAKFGLKPSPLVGKLLSEIEELQGIGRIKTKKEAFAHARKILKK